MPPTKNKNKKRPQSNKPGKKRLFLQDNFADLPVDAKDLNNGHVHFVFIETNSVAKANKTIMERYSCKDIRSKLQSLNKKMAKYSDATSEHTMSRFRATCEEPFTLCMPDLPTGSSESPDQNHPIPTPTLHTPKSTVATPSSSTGVPTPRDSIGAPAPSSVTSGPSDPSPSKSADEPTVTTTSPAPGTPKKVRSSRRRLPMTPQKQLLKSRLDSAEKSRSDMKKTHRRKIRALQSELTNFRKNNKVKYLNQDIKRKTRTIARQEADIRKLKSNLANTVVQQQLNELKKKLKSEKRKNKRRAPVKSQDDKVEKKITDLKNQVKVHNDAIKALQDEKVILEEEIDSLKTPQSMDKQGKKYSIQTRVMVYDCIIYNVPTSNVPKLMSKFARRCGIEFDHVPHRTTVEMMARELDVLSDIRAGELLMAEENLTLGFDATTQEGMHINSIHITTSDKCHVLAIDQLPGGTAEDYRHHVAASIDSITDTYCQVYSTDFRDTRRQIISHISNTMTDRAAVNHATIKQLEADWNKPLNELNCHLHPLDTIASKVRSTLKGCEPSGLEKKLFGYDSMVHQVVLAFNKFRYKDGKGDPKGLISALETAGLPKGLLPRYRGNRLHIMFEISGRLHQHQEFFTTFLMEGTVTCGGLQAVLRHDYASPVAKVEIQVCGLIGKLLTGPWMSKFYTSASSSEFSHVDGIAIVKDVIAVLTTQAADPATTLTRGTDFFGKQLSDEDPTLEALRQSPVDEDLFIEMMAECLKKIAEVLKLQYKRYFTIDVTDVLRRETESARLHNIDAETIMGMFSAAKDHAPNATMNFLSARIKACKNHVVDFLDDLEEEQREKIINVAIPVARKQRSKKRKRTEEIKREIARRLKEKLQKKKTSESRKLEKRLRECDLKKIAEEFSELADNVIETVTDILTGKVMGRQICHVWYDKETQQPQMFNGKIEKLKKKAGGTYAIGYWTDTETYEDDAVQYDVTTYALAVDFISGDVILS